MTVLKKFILLIPVLLFAVNAQAQNSADKSAKKVRKFAEFKQGDIEFKAGVGMLPTFLNEESRILTQPVQATLGYRFNPVFSVNAYAGYSGTLGGVVEYLDGSSYQSQNDFLVLGLRAEAHMVRFENIDVYGGMMLAYNKPFVTTTQITAPDATHTPSDANAPKPSPYNPNGAKNNLLVGGFVGAAYYITPHISAFGEVGYGVSVITIGAGYKF